MRTWPRAPHRRGAGAVGQAGGDGRLTGIPEDAHQTLVVPQVLVRVRNVEPVPQSVAQGAIVEQDGAGIVELVRAGHPVDGRVGGVADVADIALLAFAPGRLGDDLGVRAGIDDGDHRGAVAVREACAQNRRAALGLGLVLDGVVQKGSDCLVLTAAVLQNQARHRQQVRDVGDRGGLARLVLVQLGGEAQGVEEAVGQHAPAAGLAWLQ